MWYIYLLINENSGRTYVGATTNVARRLRQHNGEIRGGARSTSREKGKWFLLMYLSGFEGRSSAYRWEKIIKSRARGSLYRQVAMMDVSNGICPRGRGRLPQYQVPKGVRLHITPQNIQPRSDIGNCTC